MRWRAQRATSLRHSERQLGHGGSGVAGCRSWSPNPRYGLERQVRHGLLERLVRTRGVVVDDIDGVIDALEHFRQEGDLADQLIGARVARAGALPVLGFDQRVSHAQGVELLGAKAQGLVGRRSRRSSCTSSKDPKSSQPLALQ